jgi:hypothetical protein
MKALWALSLLAAGCAIGPGEPFARVQPSLDARFQVPADRAVSDGFARLASGFEIHLTSFDLGLSDVELRATPVSDDTAPVATVLSLPVNSTLGLLSGQSLQPPCQPGCELDEVVVSSIRAGVTSIHLEGVVRDGTAQKRLQGEVPFKLDLSPAPFSSDPGSGLEVATHIVADRGSPERLALAVAVAPTPDLFDDLDWASLALAGGTIDLGAQGNAAAQARVLQRLAAEALTVQVSR